MLSLQVCVYIRYCMNSDEEIQRQFIVETTTERK